MCAERADRPFVDAPVRADDPSDAVAALAARRWGLPQPVPLRRAMNALYRAGDAVVRVGRTSVAPDAALELNDALHRAGVPVLRPLFADALVEGDLAATAWPYVAADRGRGDWSEVGRIVHLVHELAADALPAAYPLPHPRSFPWWDFETVLADVADEIDGAALAGLEDTIDRHGGWADVAAGTEVVCHGDVHPGNVLVADGRTVLIDWDLMCWAPPGWDHAMLLTSAERWGGSPDVLPAFEHGYGRSLRDDPVTRSIASLRNVAATLMRVRAGRRDPAAHAEAERRLRFWRGDPDAPMWTAQ